MKWLKPIIENMAGVPAWREALANAERSRYRAIEKVTRLEYQKLKQQSQLQELESEKGELEQLLAVLQERITQWEETAAGRSAPPYYEALRGEAAAIDEWSSKAVTDVHAELVQPYQLHCRIELPQVAVAMNVDQTRIYEYDYMANIYVLMTHSLAARAALEFNRTLAGVQARSGVSGRSGPRASRSSKV